MCDAFAPEQHCQWNRQKMKNSAKRWVASSCNVARLLKQRVMNFMKVANLNPSRNFNNLRLGEGPIVTQHAHGLPSHLFASSPAFYSESSSLEASFSHLSQVSFFVAPLPILSSSSKPIVHVFTYLTFFFVFPSRFALSLFIYGVT